MSSNSPYSTFKEYSQYNLKPFSDVKVLIPCSTIKYNKYELINLFISANMEDTFYIEIVDGKSLKCPVCGISHSIEELSDIFSSEDIQTIMRKVQFRNTNQKPPSYQQNIQPGDAQEKQSQPLDLPSKNAKNSRHFHCINVDKPISEIVHDISDFIIKKLKNEGFWSYTHLMCPYCGRNISYSEANKNISLQDLIAIDKVVSEHIRNERMKLKTKGNNSYLEHSQAKLGMKEEKIENSERLFNFHCSKNKLSKNQLMNMIIKSVSNEPKSWFDTRKIICPECNNLLDPKDLIEKLTEKEFQELNETMDKLSKQTQIS